MNNSNIPIMIDPKNGNKLKRVTSCHLYRVANRDQVWYRNPWTAAKRSDADIINDNTGLRITPPSNDKLQHEFLTQRVDHIIDSWSSQMSMTNEMIGLMTEQIILSLAFPNDDHLEMLKDIALAVYSDSTYYLNGYIQCVHCALPYDPATKQYKHDDKCIVWDAQKIVSLDL